MRGVAGLQPSACKPFRHKDDTAQILKAARWVDLCSVRTEEWEQNYG
jgi:hypothetical protein